MSANPEMQPSSVAPQQAKGGEGRGGGEGVDPASAPDAELLGPAGEEEGLDPQRLTYKRLRTDREVQTLITMADRYLETIGYTDHGLGHVARVSQRAYRLLMDLGLARREAELAAIAGLLIRSRKDEG